ncbi:MAG: Cdc6/Cdc18 family protein [Halobacteriota archaeon]
MISDARALQEDFLPREVQHRDSEVNAIARALRPAVRGEPADDVFLHGPSGAGKTCIARHSIERLDSETDVEVGYVNCWNDYTRYRVLYSMLEDVGRTVDVHRRSTPRDVLYDRLRDVDQPYVVALDEVDQLEDPEVLYDVYSLPSVTMVMIANDRSEFLAGLDDRLNSRLVVGEEVRFEPYSVDALVDILGERARLGLYPDAVTESQLRLIADRAAGDARVAIGALRVAARRADSEALDEIPDDYVRDAVPEAETEIRTRTLDSLNEHQRVVYDVVREQGEAEPADVYEAYERRVEAPKTKRTLRNYLSKMAQYDLVDAEGKGRGRV